MKKISKILTGILPTIVIVPAIATIVGCSCGGTIPKEKTDQKQVNELNAILKEAETEGIKFGTMYDMIEYIKFVGGPDLEELNADGNDQYVWDREKNKIFTLAQDGTASAVPEGYTLNTNDQNIWKMVNFGSSNGKIQAFKQTCRYGQYIRKDQTFGEKLQISTSVDIGYNEGHTLEFVNDSTFTYSVIPLVIRTNKSKFIITSASSDVDHYGHAKNLFIKEMEAGKEYHEYGTVDGDLVISSATKVVAKPGSNINTIIVDNNGASVLAEANEEDTSTIASVAKTDKVTEDITKKVEVEDDVPPESKPDIKTDEPVTPPKPEPQEEAEFEYGLGTEKSPWAINSKTQLFNCANRVNNTSKDKTLYFKLINDIDLKNEEWTPIGKDKAYPFKGVFDGEGHTISNLKIQQDVGETKTYGFGLFGYVNGGSEYKAYDSMEKIWDSENNELILDYIKEDLYGASIKNITLDKVSIRVSGKSYSIGAIAGVCENTYIYNNQVISGVVNGSKTIGGIAGTIGSCSCIGCTCGAENENSSSLEIIADDYNIGGIAGMTGYNTTLYDNNAIIGCSTGRNTTITGNKNNGGGYVGGIVGANQSSSNCIISDCSNSANVIAKNTNSTMSNDSSIGGITGFGQSFSVIANCTNKGTIEIPENNYTMYASGIVSKPNAKNLIYNCSNEGEVKGYAVGGLAGITAGEKFHISSSPLQIVNCTNLRSDLLNNTNTNPNFKTADICAGISVVKFSNLKFENVNEITEKIKSISANPADEINVTFENCEITDKTGTLELPTNTATINSDQTLCENIKVGGNLNTSLKVNIPSQKISVTDTSSCSIVSTNTNNEITIEEGAQIKSVSVRGEGSKVINKGTVTRTIGIDGASASGQNDGTCANVTFGKVAVITNDKTFVNNGIITGLTDPTDTMNSVIFAKGDANNFEHKDHTIHFTNNGTIKYQNNELETPAAFFRIDALCIHIELTCMNGSMLITNTTDKWYSIFNDSDSILFKYQTLATIYENGTSLTFDQLAAKSRYAKAEPIA